MGPQRVERFMHDRKIGNRPSPIFESPPRDTAGLKPMEDPATSKSDSIFDDQPESQKPDAEKPTAPATASARDHTGEILADRVSASRIARARTQLSGLKVATNGSMAGYDRDKFRHWSDLDDNDCDERADILTRDARQITKTTKDGCKPVYGEWIDPYGGSTVRIATRLDIDHIIPLAAAWRLGAAQWDSDTREKFANDPINLLAVDASLNRQKGDKLADAWKPPRRAYWCAYAVKMIGVHAKYDLGATSAQSTQLSRMLSTC
jgi:hypothetical protein